MAGEQPAVAQMYRDRHGVLNDVVIREDGAIGAEDDPRAGPSRDGRVSPSDPEPASQLVLSFVALGDVDLDDARADLLGDGHECVREALRFGLGLSDLPG